MAAPQFVPFVDRYAPKGAPESVLAELHDALRRRRSVRMFSDRAVPRELIEGIVRVATTAPSGANLQPWRFVAVSDRALKRRIREAAEREERLFYAQRANAEWLADLEPLGTDPDKGFLEVAPWLVAVFQLTKRDDGGQTYYVKESVGLACGMFLAAAHLAGLATLTHTPSPMNFLREVLHRPAHERPFLLIPVGYPADDCVVPRAALARKPLEDVLVFEDASDSEPEHQLEPR
ncbi:MAG: nitroreductase family protein [Planctomycetes bacterium]|nr:nitroreductase family protein [Planctomycetota bacterium]